MTTKSLTFQYDGISFQFEIGAEESIISGNVESTGSWEDNQLSLYRDLIGDHGVFVDIGANVGINSIFAKLSQPNARVVAVEPEPRNFAILSRNAEKYGVELNNLAIADQPGQMGFAGTGTNAHFTADKDAIQVECVTLDAFTQSLGHIDLMKIDVEGFTDLVLSEASAALRRTSSVIIEFSYGDTESRLRTMGNVTPSRADVVEHSEELFDQLRPHFSHFYYISRHHGLVDLKDTADLYEIMFSEAAVGDILATKVPMQGAISGLAMAFRMVCELRQHNHLRLSSIQALDARVGELEGAGTTKPQRSRLREILGQN